MPQPKPYLEKISKRKTNRAKLRQAKTPEEKEVERQKQKLSQAKRNKTRAENKLRKLVGRNKELSNKLPATIRESIEDLDLDKENIVFRPNEGPQTDFLAASETEVFYGGARGGGKTYSLIIDPLRYCGNKNHRALFIRRTMPELRDIIHQTKFLYPKAFRGAKFSEQNKVWTFPSGARIEFGYSENLQDAQRYQGQAYSWIGFDELPQYPTNEVYNFIKSSARSTDPTLPVYIRATGNPGNVGSMWVKEEFIIAAPANTTFFKSISFTDPRTNEEIIKKISKRFIPAKVWDNPYLTYDDSYVSMLASLPEIQRQQFLEGNWDVAENSAFPEFNKDHHVIKPFDIPNSWVRFRAADWGYSSPFCCLWFAVDYDGNIYIYREYYGKRVIADEWATTVAFLEIGERIWYGVLDGSTDAKRGETGPSIFETINNELRKRNRIAFRYSDRSPGSRIAGKQEVHKRLALRENGRFNEAGEPTLTPSLFIFDTCKNLIRTLPMLPLDKNDPEKVDTTAEDHPFDALHYGLRSRPFSPAHAVDVNAFRQANMPRPTDSFGFPI